MILVTGAGGQVGRELLRIGAARGTRMLGLARTELDVSDGDAVHATLAAHRPTLVVNAAAYTAVDRAEADPGAALAANRDGPAHLADACAALGIPLIHLSTDYVFDGTKREPYTEDDATNPLNVYGASKLAGEDEVRTRLRRHVILRTSWVFSAYGRNFVRTMMRLAQQSPALSVVADQRGCPTPAIHLAVAILDIARQLEHGREDAWGTYHLTGRGETTWYAFAQAIFELLGRLGMDPLPALRPVTLAEFPTPAHRPAYSVLDCARIHATFGITARPWRPALLATLRTLRAEAAPAIL